MSCVYNDSNNFVNDTKYIDSLIVDGVQYVPSPLELTPNFISIGAFNWDTSLVDAINDLAIPSFFAEYPSEEDMQVLVDALHNRPTNSLRITMPSDHTFELLLSTVADVGESRLTENSSESVYLAGNWIFNGDNFPFYLFNKFGCEAGELP